jgi:hypothetical protein
MSCMGLGRVKTPVCDLRVEILSRFRQLENQKYLRTLLGEDDRENNSAHSRLVHVFTQPGSKTEIVPRNSDFRSSINSRHSPTQRLRPKSANKRHLVDHCRSIETMNSTGSSGSTPSGMTAPLVCRSLHCSGPWTPFRMRTTRFFDLSTRTSMKL